MNIDKILEQRRRCRYRQKNRAKIRQLQRAFYLSNRERIRAQRSEKYHALSPAQLERIRVKAALRQAAFREYDNARKRKTGRLDREQLRYGYISKLLVGHSESLNVRDFPSELVEAKTEQVRLLRAVRKINKGAKPCLCLT